MSQLPPNSTVDGSDAAPSQLQAESTTPSAVCSIDQAAPVATSERDPPPIPSGDHEVGADSFRKGEGVDVGGPPPPPGTEGDPFIVAMYGDLRPVKRWYEFPIAELATRCATSTLRLVGPTNWVPTFTLNKLIADVIASLVVVVMLVPQCLAYGTLAGLPPVYGIYAGIAPLVIYSLTGALPFVAVGPVAMLSVLMRKVTDAEATTDGKIAAAMAVTCIMGLISTALGILQAGILTRFISHHVTSAFTSAAAVLIILSQFKSLFAIKMDTAEVLHDYVEKIIKGFENSATINSLYTFIIACILIAYLFGAPMIPRMPRWVPHQLIAVIVTTIITMTTRLDQKIKLPIIGKLPADAPPITVPALSRFPEYFQTSAIMAVLGFVETYAVAAKLAVESGIEVDASLELIRLGLSNLFGSFFGAYAVTGGLSRTAVLSSLKPATPFNIFLTAVWVLAVLLGLNRLDVFYYLPSVTLASIVCAACLRMIDHAGLIHSWKTNKLDFLLWVITFLCVLFLGVDIGIMIGVASGLVLVVFRLMAPEAPSLALVDTADGKVLRDAARYAVSDTMERELAVFRFSAPLFYFNTAIFLDRFTHLLNEPHHKGHLKVIIVDCSGITDVDSEGAHAFYDAKRICLHATPVCHVVLSNLRAPVHDALVRADLWPKYYSPRNVFLKNTTAVELAEEYIHAYLEAAQAARDAQESIGAAVEPPVPSTTSASPDHVAEDAIATRARLSPARRPQPSPRLTASTSSNPFSLAMMDSSDPYAASPSRHRLSPLGEQLPGAQIGDRRSSAEFFVSIVDGEEALRGEHPPRNDGTLIV